jgi:hypothetical protein
MFFAFDGLNGVTTASRLTIKQMFARSRTSPLNFINFPSSDFGPFTLNVACDQLSRVPHTSSWLANKSARYDSQVAVVVLRIYIWRAAINASDEMRSKPAGGPAPAGAPVRRRRSGLVCGLTVGHFSKACGPMRRYEQGSKHGHYRRQIKEASEASDEVAGWPLTVASR